MPLFPRLGARSVIRSRSVRTWWDSTLYLVGKRMSEYGRNRMPFSWGSCPWWHRCVHEVSHPQGAPPRDGEELGALAWFPAWFSRAQAPGAVFFLAVVPVVGRVAPDA